MTKCYAFLNVMVFAFLAVMPELSKANNAPNPPPLFLDKGQIDSLTALWGHCDPITVATVNCATKTVELSAFVNFLFSGQQLPIVVLWSTGELAHKITVTPPGSWSFDPLSNPASAGCEQNHWNTTYDGPPFFLGPIEIIGPEAACPATEYELTVEGTEGFNLTYQWAPNGGTSPTQTITEPGTYSLTVRDFYGCPITDQIVIPESVPAPPLLTGSLGVCAINDTGFVKVTNPFSSYLWENGDTTNTLTIYEPGTYLVTVTNQFGCTRTSEFTVPEGPEVFPVLTGSLGLCSENDDGIVQVTIPFSSYIWDTGQTTNPITVTAPGTYTVTVTHVLGCTATNEFVIPNVDVPEILISMSTPAICPGQFSNLTADFGYSNYIWSNNDLGVSNIVTQAGTYTVTVTNSFGCTNTGSVTLDSLPTPPILVSSTPFCPGSNTTITASGAPGSPNYLWSNAQTTNPISVSTPGTYSVVVSGANFCTNTASVVITQLPPPLSFISPPAQLNCNLLQTTLDATTSSSGPDFNVNWSTADGNIVSGQNTLNPTVNAPGTYTLLVTNISTGCTSSTSITVSSNTQAPPVPVGNPALLNCTITNLNIGPVIPPTDTLLVPSWSTNGGNILSGQNSWNPNINDPGTYILVVTNTANGCSSSASVNINEDVVNPNALITPPSQLTCTMNTTALNGTGSSTGPNFSYLWTTSNGGTISGPTNALNTSAGSVGAYTLLVTNTTNGCTTISTIAVTADLNIPVTAVQAPATLTCNVTSLSIDATGSSSGPTYNYTWNGPGIIGGQGTLQPTVNAPGTYTLLLVNNANQCSATLSVLVPQDIVPPLANAGPASILNCVIPTMVLNGTGSNGANFTYLWSTQNGSIVSGGNTLNPTVNLAGDYNLLVTNTTNGCTSTSGTQVMNDAAAPDALIANPALLTCVTLQTQIDASASTQGPTYEFTWSGPGIVSGQGTANPTVNLPGIYTLDIVNTANGCTDTQIITVNQDILAPLALAGPDGLINCTLPAGAVGDASNPGGAGFTLQWTTPDGNIVGNTNGPTATVDQPGTYTLLVTNTANGCTDVDAVIVLDDFVPPVADAGPSFELNCIQPTYVIQATGSMGPNFIYQWSTLNGNIVSGGNTLNPTVNDDGTYTLLITNTANGCTSTDQLPITVSADVPVALIATPSTLTCTLPALNLDAAGTSSSPTITYSWTASNGGNIIGGNTNLNPSIDAPGTYTLIVTDVSNNCTTTEAINVQENVVNPEVNAGPDNTLTCTITNLPLQATILSSSSPNISYVWSTANGIIIGGGNTPTPTIGSSGVYTVVVTDALNGCTNTDQLEIFSNTVAPTALIANPATLTCTLTETQLNALASSLGANFTYAWTTADGNLVSGNNGLQPLVDAPGTYNLLITNTQNGCTQTTSILVLEDVVPPIAEAGNTVGLDCDTQTNTLNGTGTSTGANFSYTWSTQDGQIISGGGTLQPQIGDPGAYVLTVLNTNNGCISADNVLVTEDVNPPTFVIGNPQLLTCVVTNANLVGSGTGFGPAPSYTWTTSNGNIVSGGNALAANVDAPGTYTLTVVNTQNGCSDTEQVVVTENITAPPVNTLPVLPLTCSILQRTLTANAPAQTLLQWNTLDGNIVSGSNTPNPVVNAPGLYNVLVTLPLNGCTSIAQVTVVQELNVPTGLEFTLDPPLCNGTPGYLVVDQVNGGIGPFEYSIDGGDSFFPASDIDDLQPGITYDLVIRDANGCMVDETVPVPVPPTPAVALPTSFEILLGENQELQAQIPNGFPIQLIDQVIWTPMTSLTFEGNTTQQLLSPVAMPFVTTEYRLTILTKEGCKAESRTIIRVDRDVDIYAPNVIWPEAPDSGNNAFTLFTRPGSVQQINSLQIYDRWGEQLWINRNFMPDDPSLGWEGDHDGQPMNPGVFVWWAEVMLIDGQVILMKGDVTVVR